MDRSQINPAEDFAQWKPLIERGLADDDWERDWTALGCTRSRAPVTARLVAKQAGVWAGEGILRAAEAVAGERGMPIRLSRLLQDSANIREDQVVCVWRGNVRMALALERTAINLAAWASGVATATDELVRLARKACPRETPRICPTRKTLPGYRDLAIHAVKCGGGYPHRTSLASGVLIKENHVVAAGGIARAIAGSRMVAPHGLKIECEVRNLKELRAALKAEVDGVLLDNFTPSEVRKALQWKGRAFFEVSGGINRLNVGMYAIQGVDVLSVGGLTHSPRSLDLSLLFGGAG